MRATEVAAMIREKKLSAREVMQAHLRQIERVNPKVNAIVTLVDESKLMEQARAADDIIARGDSVGPLHGLPVGVKDLTETTGIRTTYGSPLYRDFVPDHDALVVERMKSAGAIVLGKTNTPEFGMGSHTFNPIFGATLNPYDVTKTCGGSTGGGAVALVCGMACKWNGYWWLASQPGEFLQRGWDSPFSRACAERSVGATRLVHARRFGTHGAQRRGLRFIPRRAGRLRPALSDFD